MEHRSSASSASLAPVESDRVVLRERTFYPGDEALLTRTLSEERALVLEKCQLKGLNLNGRDLRGLQVTKGSVMNQVSMEGANLAGMVLEHSRLQGSSFSAANLMGSTFRGNRFAKVNFDDANFSSAMLVKNTFDRSSLTAADLMAAKVTGNSIVRTDMPFANLSGATFAGNHLADSDLSHVRIDPKSVVSGNYYTRTWMTASGISPDTKMDVVENPQVDRSAARYTRDQYAQYVQSGRSV